MTQCGQSDVEETNDAELIDCTKKQRRIQGIDCMRRTVRRAKENISVSGNAHQGIDEKHHTVMKKRGVIKKDSPRVGSKKISRIRGNRGYQPCPHRN